MSMRASFSRHAWSAMIESSPSGMALRQPLQPLEARAQPRAVRIAAALELEQVLGVGPAHVLLADPVLDRHLHVGEEHRVHLLRAGAVAVGGDDRLDRDARRLHVDQQERDALLPLALVRGAHQAEDPVGGLRQRRPGLLAVDDVEVALRARPWCAATRGRSPSPARSSPGTRSGRSSASAAGAASSARPSRTS